MREATNSRILWGMPHAPRRAPLALAAGFLLACLPVRAQAQAVPRDCSVAGQNAYVNSTLQNIYLWYRELPVVEPAGFSSPEALLEAVRYRTFDEHFSFISGREADQAYYGDSQYMGFGFGSQVTGPDELLVSQVFPDSPASDIGLARGHQIVAINGRPVPDLLRSGEINTIFGPAEPGVTTTVRFREPGGGEREGQMVKRVVTIPTVGLVQTYSIGGRRVGYIFFRNFVTPSLQALDDAFARLAADGANELVLDVRYNGGGLISVAQHLGGLIGAEATAGQILTHLAHNDKNTQRDQFYRFPAARSGSRFTRLVVITTRSSASASELIINGLRPYIPVTVVGDATYGKPVGQYGFEFCEKVLYPVSFATKNSRGEGDYFGGLAPDCRAPDDLAHQIGDPAEGSLAAALGYLESGSCSARAASAARAASLRRPFLRVEPHRENGWQQMVGAY
jgi:carboxyl-terminal processing protease